ncbi:MAG: hypothetical protein AAF349_06705 [Cyanobacteria bacterium P01_A01_bin.68]
MNIEALAQQLSVSVEDIRIALAEVRDDFADCEEITAEEAKVIRSSFNSALAGASEVALESGMEVSQQKQIISSVSQITGQPLFLAIEQELNTVAAVQDVKNALILNVIDNKQSELDRAIRERAKQRQDNCYTALKGLADTLQQPVDVVGEMSADIEQQNLKIADLLEQVKAGK